MTEFDILKFKSLSDIIGLAIDNCIEQHSLINIRLGVYDKIKQVNGLMAQQVKMEESIKQKEIDGINKNKERINTFLDHI